MQTLNQTLDETQVYFYDTNYLLHTWKNIHIPFVISSVTLTEIENIKTSNNKSPELKYKARKVSRFLRTHAYLFETIIMTEDIKRIIREKNLDPDKPDNQICGCAYMKNKECFDEGKIVTFYTHDLNCALIANKIFTLPVHFETGEQENIYKGYRRFIGTTDEVNQFYEDLETNNDFNINEYLIVTNTDTDTTTEERWNGHKFVPLRLPNSKDIRGKNSLQRCVLDMLYNPNITTNVIAGTYGSGKTFLATKMAVLETLGAGTYQTIYGVRSPIGEGKEVGFLPGELDEKIGDFFLPLAQQLDMGIIEYEKLKDEGIIQTIIPYYMKGISLDRTFVIIDEAEDLTAKEIKLVGTRAGEGSKLVFCGDYKQAVVNTTDDNALVQLCEQFKGNPLFACIYLDEDVRSETSKLFAGLEV